MTTIQIDAAKAVDRWNALLEAVPVRPIRSNADYDEMVALMNQLLDVVGDDERHPLAPLLAIVGDQVEGYDADHHKFSKMEPHEVLRFLMDQHGLRQGDLKEIIAQPNLSAILNGHRAISREAAKSLAQRFNVAVDVFL